MSSLINEKQLNKWRNIKPVERIEHGTLFQQTGTTSPSMIIWNYGVASSAGFQKNTKGGIQRKEQQDDFVIKNFKQDQEDELIKSNNNHAFIAVFDGHGGDGGAVSGFLRENLPIEIENQCKKEKPKEISSQLFIDSFLKINNDLSKCEYVETKLSGSACVSIMLHENGDILCANLGDSRAICSFYNTKQKKYYVKDLSIDHKPDKEIDRISKAGGIVTFGVHDVPRVGGLALSRAFGDEQAHQSGVIAIPEVMLLSKENTKNFQEMMIILGSDGIFDFLTSQEVAEICVNNLGRIGKKSKQVITSEAVAKCCSIIVKEAIRRWRREYNSEYVDDTTCVILCSTTNEKQKLSKL